MTKTIIRSLISPDSTPTYLTYDPNIEYDKGYDFIWGIDQATRFKTSKKAEAAYKEAKEVFEDIYNTSDVAFVTVAPVPWWKFWIKTKWIEK